MRGRRGRGRQRQWSEERTTTEQRQRIGAWFAGRLPEAWFTAPAEVTVDDDEILVVGVLTPVDLGGDAGEDEQRTAAAARVSGFREETREQRIRIADEAQGAFGRHVAWGATCGEVTQLFTTVSVPVMTRLQLRERQVLDTLIDAGVARSRSEALAWCVRLVGRNDVEIATIASVLNTYFQVLNAQDRLRIARENVRIAAEVFKAITMRLEVGTATVLDTSQQETVLDTERALIPPLVETLRQQKNLLAVLLGRPPESFDTTGASLAKLRFPRVEPGLPSEVLLRRPDVAEAEARLASQEFSVLQARAAFFPSITLTGQYGVQSSLFKYLATPQAIGWQIMANAAQPLFDGYNLQGQYNLQQGRYAELAADYRKQTLTALSDTENALIAIAETGRQMKLQEDAVAAAQRAMVAAQARLREGTIDIVTLSTVETAYFQNQDTLEQVRLAHFEAATSLYQALGGGWAPTNREVEIARADAAYQEDKGPWP